MPFVHPIADFRYCGARRWSALVISLVLVLSVMAQPHAAQATGGEGEAWPSFTESSGCGAQRVSTVHASKQGWFNNEVLLRGEFAAMFGRSVGQVRRELVGWQIPGSSKTIAVHPAVLPALEQAGEDIQSALSGGESYRVDGDTTFSAAARTISGSLRVSRHTYGAAFDVNSRKNPRSRGNDLITDLPDWWIQSFLDAGFWWGGLWIGSKDAMHFAWQGPAFSKIDKIPLPFEPLTDPLPFTKPAASILVIPEADTSTMATILADVNGNGAIDVVRVGRQGRDLVLSASLASRRHNACSLRVSYVPEAASAAESAVGLGFGDMDGRGGQDLWIATDEQGMLRLTVRWAFGGYVAETSAVTDIPTPAESAWITMGDFDVDGKIDMYVVSDEVVKVWAIDSNLGTTALLLETPNPMPGANEYFLGDLDLDNRPDLWSITSGLVATSLGREGYLNIAREYRPLALPIDLEDVRAADYDGDGRVDLITFDGISKQVWLGNTRLPDGLPLETWFEYEDPECTDGERTWERREFRFATSTWIASGAYQWRVRNGLPVGCDPSDDDCAPEPVTRLMFTEFLAWVDGISTPSGTTNAAAWALSASRYASPCDPLDSKCLHEPMPLAELQGAFGQFLATRRGDVPAPHRWVLPKNATIDRLTSPL